MNVKKEMDGMSDDDVYISETTDAVNSELIKRHSGTTRWIVHKRMCNCVGGGIFVNGIGAVGECSECGMPATEVEIEPPDLHW